MLERAGFHESFKLSMLAALGRTVSLEVDAQIANSVGERHRVATFMADQFFQSMSRSIRNQIVASTVLANDLEIWSHEERAKTAAAFMTYENEETIGLYNLCVLSSLRSRGIGRALVNGLLARSRDANKLLTLQSHESLDGWYEALGFERIGILRAMALSDEHLAIMG